METQEITTLIRAWGAGDRSACDALFPILYNDLRRIAAAHSRNQGTLQATALVNECFLEFAQGSKSDWRDRAQFFAFAATVMRRLMVDYWREKSTAKRGGDADRILFDELIHTPTGESLDVGALDQALTRLAEMDERQARIVELRFFGGMSAEETAELLGISARTVHREWGMAKAWLASELRG
jgi:RNA polymerase sigma-70 factor, ECF subfamily